MPDPSSCERMLTVHLTVRGRRWGLKVPVPEGDARPADMLPMYRSVAEQLTAIGVHDAEAAGQHVSCKTGCGACCRQLVPITPLEARELMRVVERMPEPRRTQIRQRFADARKRFESAGLLENLLALENGPGGARLALDYFALRVPCPFLENESCSIYPDRPIACREYLVVSPAVHCAEATPENVRALVPPAGPVAMRIQGDSRDATGKSIRRVTLALAPDFAASNPVDPPPRPAERFIREFFGMAAD